LDSEARVCSLIDRDTKWGDSQLVHTLFRKVEADIICNLAIFARQQNDQMVWVGSKNGEYSVRSAYHLAKSLGENQQGSSSSKEESSSFWRKIWKLKGPNVVKSFLWKACSNVPPTKANLHRGGVIQDPLCPIYGLEPETMRHALWSFSSAKDVWLDCPTRIYKSMISVEGFVNIFLGLHEKLEEEELPLVVLTACQIWLKRNSFIFSEEFSDPMTVVRRAKDQVEAFNFADQSRRD
jgi:hypothetical protein